MTFYYGDSFEDRKMLAETYGDGRAVYMLAPWSNRKSSLRDTDVHAVCSSITHMGHIPFIGVWHFEGRVHEEPSFAVDHGITTYGVKNLLKKFKQKAAYCVTPDRAWTVYLDQL